MQLNRRFVQQTVYLHAINLGLMNEDLAERIRSFDLDAFRSVLQQRVEELRRRASSDTEFFDPEFLEGCAKSVEEVIRALPEILGPSH